MSDTLTTIYRDRQRRLEQEMVAESLAQISGRAQARMGDRRPLGGALSQGKGPTLIAEIKRASPSAGVIAEDFDPGDIADDYQRAGADAISVLTEQDHFQGHLSLLQTVRDRTSLPLLRKDFLTSAYQVVQSAAYGADAILAIVAGLDDQQLAELMQAADEWRLEVLVEVHSRNDLIRALGLGADLIGINNRDLRTLRTDIRVTESLIGLVPSEVPVVSESGFASADDMERVFRLGVRSFLVGEALMRSSDKSAWISSVKALGAMEP